jgi:hypothetical protein
VVAAHLLDQHVVEQGDRGADAEARYLERRIDSETGPHHRNMEKVRALIGLFCRSSRSRIHKYHARL